MTNASETFGNSQAGSAMAPLRAKSGWIVALGVVYLLAGFVALGSVVMATVASVLIVGVMMIVAGVAEVFSAFQIKSWGKFLLWVLLGVLYIIAGFVTFENPLSPPHCSPSFSAHRCWPRASCGSFWPSA